MANTSTFVYLVLFIFIFTGLLTLYGISQPGFSNAISGPSQCLVNNNPPLTCSFPGWNPPTPTNVTTIKNQVPWYLCILNAPCIIGSVVGTVSPNTAQAIWNGMSEIAYGIGLFTIDIVIFFNKMGAGIFLIGGISNFLNNDLGVPFLGYVFSAFLVLMIVFIGAILKPGGHGS